MPKKLFLLTLLSLFLIGCGHASKEPITYHYTAESITYADGSYTFQRNMDYIQAEHGQYYFQQDIPDSERRICVEATERILAELVHSGECPAICVLTIESPYISGNTLYCEPQDWYSIEYVTSVLLAASGQGGHYGSAYGYANVLCERLKWTDTATAAFTSIDETEIYDLNYLCFHDRFTSSDLIPAVKSLSADFVTWFIVENSEDQFQQMLLASDTSEGMALIATALEKYYQYHGQTVNISTVRYGYGGVSNDYIVSSDFACFYICWDWSDQSLGFNPAIAGNFLHETYPDIREFFEINLNQMEQYRNLFALDSYRSDLDIIFTNSTTHGTASLYDGTDHTIYLKSVMDLTHEYIHSLTIPTDSQLENWTVEGFATYFSVWYDHYSIAALNMDYNSASYLEPLRTALGRPLDATLDNDEILTYIAHIKNYSDPNQSYFSSASFVSYLVNQYGVARVAHALFGNGPHLPKSHTELVTDWQEYIQAKFT